MYGQHDQLKHPVNLVEMMMDLRTGATEADDNPQTHQLPHIIPCETISPIAELEMAEVEVMMVGPLMAEETLTLEKMTQIIQITVVPYIEVT